MINSEYRQNKSPGNSQKSDPPAAGQAQERMRNMSDMPLMDLHTHSDSSPDGEEPTTSLCEAAVDKGLFALAITDHCEVNVFKEECYDRSIKQSMFEIIKAREVFRGRLKVLVGVELGQATQNFPCAEQVVKAGFDFIIGSLHNTKGRPDFAFIDYAGENIDRLLEEYYAELLELARWGKFDVLGHLTYPLRYIVGEHGLTANLDRCEDQIDEILKALIENGCGIEVNTSTLRQALGRTMPELSQVKRFRELGGEIITVGSDAHCARHVGAGIREGIELIKAAGFTHMTYFEKRKPVQVAI